MSRLRRISPATVIACIALFVALGGAGYAAFVPINSVGTGQLRTSAVHISDIANGAVIRTKLGLGAVGSDQLGTGQVTATKYADASIGNTKLASGVVSGSKLASNSVTASKISADQVGASELKPLTVRTATVVVPGGVPAADGQYSTRAVSKSCNSGELAVGIGYHWDTNNDDDELPIISSRFTVANGSQPNGALVRGGNDTATDRTLTVEVNCLAG